MGLAADIKPASGVEHAALFYEHDTGKTFIWTGYVTPPGAGWVEYIPLYPMAFDSENVQR